MAKKFMLDSQRTGAALDILNPFEDAKLRGLLEKRKEYTGGDPLYGLCHEPEGRVLKRWNPSAEPSPGDVFFDYRRTLETKPGKK